MSEPAHGRSGLRGPRIAVVGPCASGKSTLSDLLRARGYDARPIGQEHSGVRRLWDHVQPDILVLLEIDLATLRSRRSPTWPQTIYLLQHERLLAARTEADIIIDTSKIGSVEAADLIEHFVNSRDIS